MNKNKKIKLQMDISVKSQEINYYPKIFHYSFISYPTFAFMKAFFRASNSKTFHLSLKTRCITHTYISTDSLIDRSFMFFNCFFPLFTHLFSCACHHRCRFKINADN